MRCLVPCLLNFYSRPCGRGDELFGSGKVDTEDISTHAPAGGATGGGREDHPQILRFLLTPLREGRHHALTVVQP